MPDRQVHGCWKRPLPTDRAPAARTGAIGRREPRAVPGADLERGVARDVRGLGLRLACWTVDESYSTLHVTQHQGNHIRSLILGPAQNVTHTHRPRASDIGTTAERYAGVDALTRVWVATPISPLPAASYSDVRHSGEAFGGFEAEGGAVGCQAGPDPLPERFQLRGVDGVHR